jgi:DNA-binding Xre family transcriptional regulator
MKKTDLATVISGPTIAKIFSGQNVNTEVLCAICAFLKCDISNIVEYEYDESEMKKQSRGIKPRKQDESENKSDVFSDAE